MGLLYSLYYLAIQYDGKTQKTSNFSSILGTLKNLSPKFGLMQKRNWMQDYLRQGPTYCPWFMTCNKGRSMAFVDPWMKQQANRFRFPEE